MARTSLRKLPEQVCKDLLPEDYEMHKPDEEDGESSVFTWVQIIDIGDINEENMDFELHAYVTYVWRDSRLKVENYTKKKEPTIMSAGCRDYIWTPNIVYETAKDIKPEQKNLPTTVLKILLNGAIYVSTKYSFRARCPMDLKYYPFDTQNCIFRIGLCNYTSLLISFRLVRLLTGAILNIYLPSALIVVMSMVGFWLGTDAVPARVALSVTSLLTLCTQVHQYRVQLPPVNYLKAMDVWLFMCIFTVFLTLVEFAISHNQITQGKIVAVSPLQSTQDMTLGNNLIKSNKKILVNSAGSFKKDGGQLHSCNTADSISRKMFPVLFIIFVIIYWVQYMSIYYENS